MADIPIDRNLFQRILNRYFELEIENRAYGAMVTQAAITKPVAALEYARLYREAIPTCKAQFESSRRTLAAKLDAGDDAAAQRELADLFPPRSNTPAMH
jgi:hypothetical protein